MNKLVLGCLMGIITLYSCNRRINVSLENQKGNLKVIVPQFEYLSAKARFKLNNKQKEISATAHFRIKKDSIIWISISGLGVEGVRILIDSTHIHVLNKLKKKYSKYPFKTLSEQYDFDLSFQMIQSMILGCLIEPYKNQNTEKRNGYHTYTTSKGIYLIQNHIGTKSMKLEILHVFDKNTKNSITVNYSDFISVEKQLFPKEIITVINYEPKSAQKTEISISYNKIKIEDDPIQFPYSVPNKYEKE